MLLFLPQSGSTRLRIKEWKWQWLLSIFSLVTHRQHAASSFQDSGPCWWRALSPQTGVPQGTQEGVHKSGSWDCHLATMAPHSSDQQAKGSLCCLGWLILTLRRKSGFIYTMEVRRNMSGMRGFPWGCALIQWKTSAARFRQDCHWPSPFRKKGLGHPIRQGTWTNQDVLWGQKEYGMSKVQTSTQSGKGLRKAELAAAKFLGTNKTIQCTSMVVLRFWYASESLGEAC